MSVAAITIRTSISQPFIVAGTPFTLTTTLANAHEEQIEVVSYVYHVPFQVQWILDTAYAAAAAHQKSLFGVPISRPAWKQAAQPRGTVLTCGYPNGAALYVLQSGESWSYSFNLIVPSWLFQPGGQLTFQGSIVYRYKGVLHTSPFEVTFPVRPPLLSMTIGAVAGSVLGTLAQIFRDHGTSGLSYVRHGYPEYGGAGLLAVILATIAVAFASRRSADSQPVVTIENFWGGVTAGFLIGFVGQDYFQKLISLKSA
jgi:hypothetical protein